MRSPHIQIAVYASITPTVVTVKMREATRNGVAGVLKDGSEELDEPPVDFPVDADPDLEDVLPPVV